MPGYRIQAVVAAVGGDDIAQVTNVPDARLIAKAPEMLALLAVAVADHDEHTTYEAVVWEDSVRALLREVES